MLVSLRFSCYPFPSALSSCVCGPHFALDTLIAECVISDDDVYSKSTSADLTFRLLFTANTSAPGGVLTPASTGVLSQSSAAFGQFKTAVVTNLSLALTLPLDRLFWLTAKTGGGTDANDPTFVDVTVRISPAAPAASSPARVEDHDARSMDGEEAGHPVPPRQLRLGHQRGLTALWLPVPPSPMLVGVVAAALVEESAPSWYTAGVLVHTADKDVAVHAVLADTTPTLSKLVFAGLVCGALGFIVVLQLLKVVLKEPNLTDVVIVVVAWYDLASTVSYVDNLYANNGQQLPDSTARALAVTIVALKAVVYVVNVTLLLRSQLIDMRVARDAKLATVLIVATSGLTLDASLMFVSGLCCGYVCITQAGPAGVAKAVCRLCQCTG
jgi:hypothetical protein